MTALNSLDEKELLIKLRSGDEQAFDQLYARYSLRIYGNILKMVKDADIAQELLQDVFFKVWEKRYTIDPELSFKSYLFKISKHLVYNFFRRESIDKKVKDYIASISTEIHTSVEDEWAYKESKQLLEQAIERLPPQRKLVYTLCKLEGKSYDEVSSILNISTSTISDHIVKATRFIKEKHRLYEGPILIITACLFHDLYK
ncbi:RNA polymerase sigma factor [Mucilaginibacter sp.]